MTSPYRKKDENTECKIGPNALVSKIVAHIKVKCRNINPTVVGLAIILTSGVCVLLLGYILQQFGMGEYIKPSVDIIAEISLLGIIAIVVGLLFSVGVTIARAIGEGFLS